MSNVLDDNEFLRTTLAEVVMEKLDIQQVVKGLQSREKDLLQKNITLKNQRNYLIYGVAFSACVALVAVLLNAL